MKLLHVASVIALAASALARGQEAQLKSSVPTEKQIADVIGALQESLSRQNSEMQTAAIKQVSLLRANGAEVVPLIAANLDKFEKESRDVAISVLTAHGGVAARAISNRLNSTTGKDYRKVAVRSLLAISKNRDDFDSAINVLLRLAYDPDEAIAAEAIYSLFAEEGKHRREAWLADLLKIAKDGAAGEKAREAAICSIGYYGQEAKVHAPALRRILSDGAPGGLVGATSLALAKLDSDSDETFRVLKETLRATAKENIAYQGAVIHATLLMKQGHNPEVKRDLFRLLDSPKQESWNNAIIIRSLAQFELGDDEMRVILLFLIRDRGVRQSAASTLVRCGPKAERLVPRIVSVLEDHDLLDKDETLLEYLVPVLGGIGEKARPSIPVLRQCAVEFPRYEDAVAEAIRKIRQ